MRIQIPQTDADRLALLADAADLSSARWVRAAIRAADGDPAVAERIRAAAPDREHGGSRPGAGRPRRPDDGEAVDPRRGA